MVSDVESLHPVIGKSLRFSPASVSSETNAGSHVQRSISRKLNRRNSRQGTEGGRTMITRRQLLQSSFTAGVAAALGSSTGCSSPPRSGGKLMGLVPFLDEPPNPPRVVMNSGLDGRLTLDLASLTPQTLITPNDDFFIRTCEPDQLDPRTSW